MMKCSLLVLQSNNDVIFCLMARVLVLEIAKGIDNSVTLLMKLSELHTSTHTPPSPPLSPSPPHPSPPHPTPGIFKRL